MIAAPSRPSRLVVVTGLVAVLAAATGTATAATTRPTAARPVHHAAIGGHSIAAATIAAARPVAGATQQVELALTPRDRRGLTALAAAHGLSRSVRLGRLDAALPGAARAAQVGALVRRLGLTVTGSNALTLTASGPAATVAALFGTEQAPGLATAQALPRVPGALQGLVTVAYGGDDTRPAELPLAVTPATDSRAALTVAQTRSLYGTTATTATPSSTAPIVATLQFTSCGVVDQAIRNADTFASRDGLYGNSSYHPSSNIVDEEVDGACSTSDDNGGDEVALDTQTLLAVAPQLRQRVYTAPNTGAAQDDAIADIVDDVQDGAPIVALSTSWGACEDATYGSTTADVDAVDALLGAGVTMFAASGDQGSFDCITERDGQLVPVHADAVDAPAAIPGVVAVGGTTGGTDGTRPVVWADDAVDATGGGFSCGFFARPSYQSAVARAAAYPNNGLDCPAGRAERMVPDIAENGGNGIDAVVTDSQCPSICVARVFGTSFAAPLAAGGFAQTLVAAGRTTGLGDIHGLLYGSPGLTDIVTGRNGDYAAAAGYDLASGLGAPSWSSVLSPKAGVSMLYEDPTLGPTVAVGYAATAPLGLTSITMRVTDQTGTQVAGYSGTVSGHQFFDAVIGNTYTETVAVTDSTGTTVTRTTALVAPYDEHRYMQFTAHTGWVAESSSLNWAHTDTGSSTAHAQGKITVTARSLSVLMRTGPDFGEVLFYVDGTRVRTWDGYAPRYGYRVVVPLISFASAGTHVVQLVVVGAHDTHATGSVVRIDAVLAQR